MFHSAYHRLFILIALAVSFGSIAGLQAQTLTNPSDAPPIEARLKSLVNAIEAQEQARSEKKDRLNNAVTTEERKLLFDELTGINEKLDNTIRDLASLASGVPFYNTNHSPSRANSLQEEVSDLLVPVISVLKEATEKPRAIEALTTKIQANRDRLIGIKTSIENITNRLQEYKDAEVKKRLNDILVTLKSELLETENDINIQEQRRADLKAGQKSIFSTLEGLFSKYFQVRLLNIFLAVVTFVILSFGARLAYQSLNRFSMLKNNERHSFYRRLAGVLYYGLTFLGAIFAAMLVLYVRGDWMLLTLGFLFLAGLALVAKNALPRYYEQTRMLLNLGEVREGERIVIDKVPWLVESLNFFTILSNPRLTGGQLRIPILQLSSMISRPYDPREPWFPCEEGDWVLLKDEGQARVVLQTPEQVQVQYLGDAKKTYSIASFLDRNPKNLSHGFRISTTISLDYGHQADITRAIPDSMQKDVCDGLLAGMERGHLRQVVVEFATAATSSLDLYIGVDLTGEVANRHDQLLRLLQCLAVESCQRHGWNIPLPQLNLHLPSPIQAPKMP